MSDRHVEGTTPWEPYMAEREEEYLEELLELLRIPSVSTAPEHRDDVRAAATWVAERLRRAGVPEVEVAATDGHPAVVGRWHAAPGKATVLIYGHYDVQPPEPLDLWTDPPFEPTIRDGRIYARGASDMKANLLTTVQAVEALAATTGAPPVNVTFLFEGEEEIGSPNLPALVRADRERLACDVAISADGGMYGPDQPSLTTALKGLAGCQIDVKAAKTDLHSGGFGSFVANGVQALVQIAASFHTADGRVAIAGFYDRVQDLSAEDRAAIAALGLSDEALLARAGAEASWGEPGYSAAERQGGRPTLDLNGFWGGFQGAGLKTVTPTEAHVKVTCRLVPDQEPSEIIALIERHVAQQTPPGVTATVTRLPGSARPFSVRRDHPALVKAQEVLRRLYGKDPLLPRSGGTVPITAVFQEALGADTISLGWGLPDSRAHAPNEWYRVVDFPISRRVYCAYLEALGA